MDSPKLRHLSSISITDEKGIIGFALVLIFAICAWFVISYMPLFASAATSQPQLRSGIVDFCVDDHNSTKIGTSVYLGQCSGTVSQKWSITGKHIVNNSKYCLGVSKGKVVIDQCKQAINQNWLVDGVGLQNESNRQCLAMPNGNTTAPITTASCSNLSSVNESWTPDYWTGKALDAQNSPACRQSMLGARVACNAQRQWLAWQTEPSIHQVLLSDYTDGNPYEEWCADFVSYIYKQSGAPFTNGERGNGWDEYNANNIQYMGFTYHAVGEGYIPKAGDVAYFNYSGGHVEIVVKGGSHPTFIYGDSGTIDPLTKNGDMAKNNITSDGGAGGLQYYLAPTFK